MCFLLKKKKNYKYVCYPSARNRCRRITVSSRLAWATEPAHLSKEMWRLEVWLSCQV